jgi:sulfate transport system permease protein
MTVDAHTDLDVVSASRELRQPSLPRAAPLTSNRRLRRLVIGVVLAYLAIVLLAPIAALVSAAVESGLRVLAKEISSSDATSSLLVSLALAACAVLLNGLFGIAVALVLVRDRYVLSPAIATILDLSLAVSPVMAGLAILLLFGRGGWFEGFSVGAFRIPFAFPGLVVGTLFVTLPYVASEVAHMLREVGTEEEAAAATLGASAWRTFRRITLPNVRRGLFVGSILTVTRALGEFGAVIVIGGAIAGKTQTATTFIYAATEERRRGAAVGMALILASVSVIALAIVELSKRRSKAG